MIQSTEKQLKKTLDLPNAIQYRILCRILPNVSTTTLYEILNGLNDGTLSQGKYSDCVKEKAIAILKKRGEYFE